MWLTVKEVSDHLGLSVSTIRRRIKKGEWDTKEEKTVAGGSKKLLIHIATSKSVSNVSKVSNSIVKTERSGAVVAQESHKLRVTGSNPVSATISRGILPSVASVGGDNSIALGKAALCNLVLNRCKQRGDRSRKVAIEEVVELYNNGLLSGFDDFRSRQGTVSERTVYRWLKEYLGAERDYTALKNQYTGGRKSLVRKDDLARVIGIMFHPDTLDHRVSISSAVRWWRKRYYEFEGKEPPVADRTMIRAVERYKKRHILSFLQLSEGEKYIAEKILPTTIIDYSYLNVGDMWFCDGKTLNFMVIDPLDGKPKRPTFVAYMDAVSRMIVGGELGFSESYKVVSSAYRNAIMNWGFSPNFIKSDNGKSFRAAALSLMEQCELQGLYARSGVKKVSWALPYNAKAKAPLERFFGTMNDLESKLPSYVGINIEGKPVGMNRGEKWIRKFINREPLSVEEAKHCIVFWIMSYYGTEPHPFLNGRTPLAVWEEGIKQIPASRRLGDDMYDDLMLDVAIKRVRSEGIKFNGILYWAEELIELVALKESAKIRYNNMDDSHIYVYDKDDYLVCKATPRISHHPLAFHIGDEYQRNALSAELKHRNKLKKEIRKNSKELFQLQERDRELLQGPEIISDEESVDILNRISHKKEDKKTNEHKSVEDAIIEDLKRFGTGY